MSLAKSWKIKFNTTPPQSETTMQLVLDWYNQDSVRINRIISKLNELCEVEPTKKVAYHINTKIVRRWRGKTYEVDVVDKGFLYDGTIYSSLTAIATKITGVHQSGKLFFKQMDSRSKT